MATRTTLSSNFDYARSLIDAGLQGIVSAGREAGGLARPNLRRDELLPAVIGAGIGILSASLTGDRKSTTRIAAGCLVGGALGFGLGVAWGSRDFTRSAVQGALRNMNTLRDDRWLEKNPIAYG